MINLEYEITKSRVRFWEVIGFISAFLTLGLTFKYYYAFFFERKAWYLRKNLLEYILDNPLKCGQSQWNIGPYHLHTFSNTYGLFKGETCILCRSIATAGPDLKRCQKLFKLIKEASK